MLVSSSVFANYGFAPDYQPDVITMDVIKYPGDGTSGTWKCVDEQSCITKVREAEYRGQTQGCRLIQIKRNGDVVWHRDYNTPFWQSRRGMW